MTTTIALAPPCDASAINCREITSERRPMTPRITIPLPGEPVRGSRSGAPIMALLDLLGRRWALGIVRVLAEAGALSFSALQTQCESISPGVLNTRLKELILARIIEPVDRTYRLTSYGQELFDLITPLGRWARVGWASALAESE